MNHIFKCTEVENVAGRKIRLFWLRCPHLVHMSCTKPNGDITIAILAGKHPKIIYNMSPFEFAKTVANSTGVQGAKCKFAPHAF